MNQSDAISRSAARPAQSGADAAQWVEIYFPGVDDLLRRLVQGHTNGRSAARSRSGPWTMATICVVCFIFLPGCAAAAILLMKSGNFHLPPVQVERMSARADRLPLIQPIHHFGETQSALFGEIGNRADLFEPVALRGSIRSALLATPPSDWVVSDRIASDGIAPNPPPANARKSRRSTARATPVKPSVENPPPPRPPSLFEKLFSVLLPVSQSPGQT